ncbi:hypothetical protein DXG03_002088 [Asterophora parasitica]|uniref:Uncharacterized protein n=1 Tax=Asterophora parasitica TaxID=117018 RepID=A0A9P7G2Q2_9AGAR|nr:hypothetical protein DXG03_002088 [Asterophora parasitica]
MRFLLKKVEGIFGSGSQGQAGDLGDKINFVLGDGQDALDKAIDLVQEHVLGQGQQKNETAIEQLKDKQQGVKNLIGKDIPSWFGALEARESSRR